MPPATIREPDVLNALRKVPVPGMDGDVVSLGLMQELRIVGGNITFNLLIPRPVEARKKELQDAVEAAVAAIPGAERVLANPTAPAGGGKPLMAGGQPGAQPGGIPGVANILAVSSGKGGVGKSWRSIWPGP